MGRPRRSSASLAVDNADAVAPQVSRNHPQAVKPFPGIPDRPQEILLTCKSRERKEGAPQTPVHPLLQAGI